MKVKYLTKVGMHILVRKLYLRISNTKRINSIKCLYKSYIIPKLIDLFWQVPL